MNILYLSPSLLPSRSANSIHVVRMCEAFSQLGHDVVLVSGRSILSSQILEQNVEKYYGVKFKTVRLLSFYWPFSKVLNSILGPFSFILYFLLRMKRWKPDLIISRNLYASFLITPFISRGLVFETHQLEQGLRKYLQCKLIQSKRMHTIVISQALKQILEKHAGYPGFQPLIFHDAAPTGIQRLSEEVKIKQRASLFGEKSTDGRFKKITGYFGHLYPGRGVDIIGELSNRHPDIAFMIFGGNEEQIRKLKKVDHAINFMVMGYVEPNEVTDLIGIMDILMMPYQKKVSIGDNRSDTSCYMSPMKMFEYMACGVPIIASDLPSIKEVLVDRHNCLLAKPDDVDSWSNCITCLCDDDELAQRIGNTAHNEYKEKYSWDLRAKKIIHAIGGR